MRKKVSTHGCVTQNPGRYIDPRGEFYVGPIARALGWAASKVAPKTRPVPLPLPPPPGSSPNPIPIPENLEACEEVDCGPLRNPEARLIAFTLSGIQHLQNNNNAHCATGPDGEIICSCPGRQQMTAELRHDGPHLNLPSKDGHPAHHDCPHWFWRNCSGAKGNVKHKHF